MGCRLWGRLGQTWGWPGVDFGLTWGWLKAESGWLVVDFARAWRILGWLKVNLGWLGVDLRLTWVDLGWPGVDLALTCVDLGWLGVDLRLTWRWLETSRACCGPYIKTNFNCRDGLIEVAQSGCIWFYIFVLSCRTQRSKICAFKQLFYNCKFTTI